MCDDSKDQCLSHFRRKLKEDDVRLKPIEPCALKSNQAEQTISELKRATGRIMLRTKPPNKLWDNFMELTALQRMSAALNAFELQGLTPETKLAGEVSIRLFAFR